MISFAIGILCAMSMHNEPQFWRLSFHFVTGYKAVAYASEFTIYLHR